MPLPRASAEMARDRRDAPVRTLIVQVAMAPRTYWACRLTVRVWAGRGARATPARPASERPEGRIALRAGTLVASEWLSRFPQKEAFVAGHLRKASAPRGA